MAQYRIPVEETFSFQRPVKNITEVTAPAGPAKGDRYIAAGIGGAWSTAAINDILWYDGAAWQHDTPIEGWMVYDLDSNAVLVFSGAAWAALPTGVGDMTKAEYDTNAQTGVVDNAEGLTDGTNTCSALEAQTAYDSRGTWDAALGCILMTI